MSYFLQLYVFVLASSFIVCANNPSGCSYDTLILCPSFNFNDTTCNGTLIENGFTIGSPSLEYSVIPNSTIHNVLLYTYQAFVVSGMCNVSQVTPLDIFSGDVNRALCSSVTSDPTSNELTFECAMSPDPQGIEIVVYTHYQPGPYVSCGFTETALIALFNYSQSDCDTLSPICEGVYNCNNLTDFSEIYSCWEKCAYSTASFDQDECLQQECDNFFCEVCALECGVLTRNATGRNSTSDVRPHCLLMCSSYYRSETDSQCMKGLQRSPCEFYGGCPDYEGIDCNGTNETECRRLCKDLSSLRHDCSDGLEGLFNYCATIPLEPDGINCSSNSLLGAIDCRVPIDARCDAICSLDVYHMIRVLCPQAVDLFCADYLNRIINVTFITTLQYQKYLAIVDNLVEDVQPGVTVQQVGSLISNLLEEGSPLGNDTNTALLVDIFDDLFDDDVIQNWIEEDDNANAEDSALLNIESIGKKVSMDLMDLGRTSSYEFVGENFAFTAARPNTTNVVNNMYTVSRAPSSSKEGGGTLMIPMETLCGNTALGNCTSVVMMAVMRNMADLLHRQASSSTANNPNSTISDYSSLKPNTHLITVRAFGVSDLQDKLSQMPLDIFFNPLQTNTSVVNMSSSRCIYWDHQAKTWSTNGVTTSLTPNNRIKCTSTHLTSFAVLVSFNSEAFDNHTAERIAINVVSYIGCTISIVCLTATIVCLIIFRKILNKGSLLYIHLNLSIALLLGYVTFVAGIETATPIPGLCTFVAALIQYFFLCVFCWMLAEGIMLYLLVVRVFGTAAQKWYYLLFLGWGLPVPIVVISAGVLRDDYGNENYCWISSDPTQAAVWTFVVPVLIVVMINTVILVLTVCSIVRGKKHGGAETGVSNVTLAKTAIRGAVILLPLLGLTWVIGLFAVNDSTTVFAWLFVIFNTLQGLFLFILHVLRNRALLRKIRLICRRHSPKTSDRGSSSGYSSKLATKLSALESVEDNKDTLLRSLPSVDSKGGGAQWPLSDEKSVTVFVSENKEDLLEEKTTVTNNPETPDDKL